MDYQDEKIDQTLYHFFAHRSFRSHQKEGLECIRTSSLKGIPLIFNSPTGTGKTAMVLGGVLESRAPGEKLAVITRTHSQYRIFLEEFLRVRKRNPNLTLGMLIGRTNLCPIGVGHLACSMLRKASSAEIKKGGNTRYTQTAIQSYERSLAKYKTSLCPYYLNCFQTDIQRPLFSRDSMELVKRQMNGPENPEAFMKRCITEKYPKCPYELMKATLAKADAMILHYQYILDPEVREAVLASNWLGAGPENIHLVIDEAHNLAPYIQEICSTECSKKDVEEAIKLLRDEKIGDVKYSLNELGDDKTKVELLLSDLNVFLDQRFSAKDAKELSGEGSEDVLSGKDLVHIDPEALKLLEHSANLVKKQFEAKKRAGDVSEDAPVPGICRVHKTITQTTFQEKDRYINTLGIRPRNASGTTRLDGSLDIGEYDISLKVVDIDPRDSVKYLKESFRSLTLLSGTLTPTGLYKKLLFPGDMEVNEVSIPFPFPEENRIVLGCMDVSSQKRLRDNEKNIASVKECIKALFAVKGNIAVFFTGYEMKKTFMEYCLQQCRETGKKPMDETRGINRSEFIEEYKRHKNAALFAVCRGSFSEGVDYLGEAMNAVAVIGLPLAPWNEKQQLINRYYERAYGLGIGKTIAYDLPAVTAAVQALGRCIRSPTDTGVMLLADTRYTNDTSMGVKKILPDWMQKEMQTVGAKTLEGLVRQKQELWQNRPKTLDEEVMPDEEESTERKNKALADIDELPDEDRELYEILKSWRLNKAKDEKIIIPRILSNKTLKALAHYRPASIEEVQEIKGFGPQKTEEYGEEIVALIRHSQPEDREKDNDDTTAKAILETVRDTDETYGTGKIAEILGGSKARFIKDARLERLTHYARFSHMSQKAIQEKIEKQVRNGFLYKTFGLYPALKLKEKGRKELRRLSG